MELKLKQKHQKNNLTNEQQLTIMKEHLEESIKLNQEEYIEFG